MFDCDTKIGGYIPAGSGILSTAMISPTILVVEDDPEITRVLIEALRDLNPNLTAVTSGEEALAVTEHKQFDLVLLDLGLIGMGGLEVCRRMRESNAEMPIMILSSRSEEIDKVLALELGADDYMTKPFGIREVLARVNALLRRAGRGPARGFGTAVNDDLSDEIIKFREITLNLARHEIAISGKLIPVTPMEFRFLTVLICNRGRVLTRQDLVEEVMGFSGSGHHKTVDVHISRLRDKIETDPRNPRYILTVRGLGYRFADEQDFAE